MTYSLPVGVNERLDSTIFACDSSQLQSLNQRWNLLRSIIICHLTIFPLSHFPAFPFSQATPIHPHPFPFGARSERIKIFRNIFHAYSASDIQCSVFSAQMEWQLEHGTRSIWPGAAMGSQIQCSVRVINIRNIVKNITILRLQH